MRSINRFFTVAAIFLFTFLYSCTGSSQTRIPATWQPGMKLTMSYGGGMRYYSYHTEITDTASYYEVNDGGVVTKTKLVFTQKDLNELLTFLRSHHFDKIKTAMHGITYDKGTESIALSWKDGSAIASDGSTESIAEESMDDYRAVRDFIEALIAKKGQPSE